MSDAWGELPRRYVDLYTPLISQTGEKNWALCEGENSLIKGRDEPYRFCAGIYLTKQPQSLSNFLMIYIMFDNNRLRRKLSRTDDRQL